MAQPVEYNRRKDFTDQDGDDTDHNALNQEFDAAAQSINQIRDNLALIQKDDGNLENGIIGKDQLAPDAFDAFQADLDAAVARASTAADESTRSAVASGEFAAVSQSASERAVQAESNAEASAANAAGAAKAMFDGIYLGSRDSDPVVDGNGQPLTDGDFYFNNVAKLIRTWDVASSKWVNATPSGQFKRQVFVAGAGFTPGTTVALTLASDPLTSRNVFVHFDAAYQHSSEYSLAGQTLTFTSPIPIGVQAVEVAYLEAIHYTVSDALLVFETKAKALAAMPRLPDGQLVDALDEQERYKVQGGALGFVERLRAFLHPVGLVKRWLESKLADIVSVKDFDGKGDGLTDDTAAINATRAASSGPFFPDGIYPYTGDIDALFALPIFGPGVIRYAGFDYPAVRSNALNVLWPGEFQCWPMAHALLVETTQRRMIPSGVTHARANFAAGTTVYHVDGEHVEDAMRIQRNPATAGTESHTAVISLTREETRQLLGKRCVLQFNGKKGATYSGAAVTARVQYSAEQAQAILNADGTYTSGHTTLISQSVALGTSPRPEAAPFFFEFDLPEDATQLAVVFVVPFSGTAGAEDFIDLEGVSVHSGARPANILRESFAALMVKSDSRYQTSYPYGAPRGTNTEQGSVSAVAVTTAVNWALQINVRFKQQMAVVPQFIFQSPTSGTESRLLNKGSGANINALAFSLSESGAVITNNAIAVPGNRYLCHWTAIAII